MTGFNPIMMLFEGVCPSCNAEVEITRIAGTKWFHDTYSLSADGVEPATWIEPFDSEGEVEFMCDQNGHIHCIGVYRDGDWNL